MHWITRVSCAAVCTLCVALAGCDEGEVSVRDASCSTLCAKLELCNDATDVPGCEQRCKAEIVRSDAYFEARSRCVDRLSCNHLARELGPSGEDLCKADCQVVDCVDDALAAEGHSQDMEDMCFRSSNKLVACDSTLKSADIAAACMELAPALSGDYLEESGACVDLACERISPCLGETADRYDTELLLFGAER
jgi:hypothetical protein